MAGEKVVLTDLLVADEYHSTLDVERAVFDPLDVELTLSAGADEDSIIAAGQDATGMLVTYARITRRILESLPDLKIVVKLGIGYDNIDTASAAELGIYTVNVPDYGDEEVASHAMAFILDAIRAMPQAISASRDGVWLGELPTLGVRRPSALTIGTVGMGRIARKLHTYLQPLGANLRYFDPFVDSYAGAERCNTLEELFASCEVISLHLPLNESTRNIVSDGLLQSARPDLVLVNTSRAGLVDRAALVRALDGGRLRMFGTDVFWQEPPDLTTPDNARLVADDRVMITPHMAWYSRESDQELRRKGCLEIVRVLKGARPLHVVRNPG